MRSARKLIAPVAAGLVLLATSCVDPNEGGGGGDTTTSTSTTVPTSTNVTRIASGGSISSAVISRNGRYVAYVSTTSTPGPDGNAGGPDIFVIDRQSSTTTRVSSGNGASDSPSVADDGSVVFRSASTDLGGAGDVNGHVDAFRWTTGGVTRITDSSADVVSPLVSADGSTVVFGGPESLTVPGGSTRTETLEWLVAAPASITLLAAVGPNGSAPTAISGTGDRVLLAEPGRLSVYNGTTATEIAGAPASPPPPDVTTFAVAPDAFADDGDVVFAEITYSLDSVTGVLTFGSGTAKRWDSQTATVSTLGLTGSPAGPVQSADGLHVVYTDMANVAIDQDNANAYLRGAIRSFDTTSSSTVAVASAAQAIFGTVSADGRYVAFVSTDSTLAPGDPNPSLPDVYLWDRDA